MCGVFFFDDVQMSIVGKIKQGCQSQSAGGRGYSEVGMAMHPWDGGGVPEIFRGVPFGAQIAPCETERERGGQPRGQGQGIPSCPRHATGKRPHEDAEAVVTHRFLLHLRNHNKPAQLLVEYKKILDPFAPGGSTGQELISLFSSENADGFSLPDGQPFNVLTDPGLCVMESVQHDNSVYHLVRVDTLLDCVARPDVKWIARDLDNPVFAGATKCDHFKYAWQAFEEAILSDRQDSR